MLQKRILAIICAMAMLLSAAGCVSGGTPAPSAGEPSAEDAADATSPPPAEEEPVEEIEEETPAETPPPNPYAGAVYPEGEPVTAWAQPFGDVWLAHFQKQVHDYNSEGNGYVVTEEYVAGAAWDERLQTARASDTVPDIYIQSYNHIPSGIKNGYYTSFDGIIDQAILDDMLSIVRSMVSFEGKTYAIPLLAEPSQILYYRKDLLEAGGYSAPPTSWAELIEMANALKTDEIYGLGIPNWGGEISWSTWGMQYGNVGHGPLTDNWDAPAIDDGYREMALFFKELYDTGAVPEQPLSAYTDIKPMGQGDYVFQICGSWAVGDLIRTYTDMWPNIGLASVPTNDGNLNKTTATIGGWVYVLDARAKNPQGAASYLNWLCDSANPQRLGEYYIGEQFSKAAPFSKIGAWVESQAPAEADYVEVINSVSSFGQPEAAYLWDISARVGLMFEEVAMGYDSVDNALQTCADDIQILIDDNQLAGTNPRKP
ncbi:MAG: extracellular solute-binding protein [Clostridiales bacterium]|jgi:multiple sugar transport system substrate-binding protein|nr:extracellular solute-binding protein [Clostridiales bacterium]